MSAKPTLLVLSTHSFLDESIFVGMQIIPTLLARSGWEVDYVSVFSSPLDLVGARRRKRLRRVWLERQDVHGHRVEGGLTEYCFRTPFPAHAGVLRFGWQFRAMGALLPHAFVRKEYDACLFDVTPTAALLPFVRARRLVYRLNDYPPAFERRLPRQLSTLLSDMLTSDGCDEIWPVSAPLADHARRTAEAERIHPISNGYRADLFEPRLGGRKARSCVYLGAVEDWFDQELLIATARLLPQWTFDICGPLSVPWRVDAPNVRLLPPVAHGQAPALLADYRVGLVPFREFGNLIGTMERPLKFYEYLASGLGVACVDVPSLRAGMGGWCRYGSRPQDFAAAIERAEEDADGRMDERRDYLKPFAWPGIVRVMDGRLRALVETGT